MPGAPPRAPRPISQSEIPPEAVQATDLGTRAHGPVLLHGLSATDTTDGLTRTLETWEFVPSNAEGPVPVPVLILESSTDATTADGERFGTSAKRITSIRRIAANEANFAVPPGIEIVRNVFDELEIQRR